jgi:DNA-binding phage protein
MPATDLIADTVPPQEQKPKDPSAMHESEDEASSEVQARRALVKQWGERIRTAKAKWEEDFKRMRSNMEFVYGLQWNGQQYLTDQRYIANFTIRAINQKVATLYARNPQVTAQRRPRLDFEVWDGKMESIMQATGAALQSMNTMGFVPPEAMALLNDFQRGRQMQQLVERVGKSLETVYQYQMDTQEPTFKTQAKQFVRRVAVCGVGYIKVIFCRNYETNDLTQSETRQSTAERVLRAKLIFEKLQSGKIDETSAEVQTLKDLVGSFNTSPVDSENVAVKERLIFDFAPATSIIPDDRCRNLKGFVGAHWVAEEFIYPLDYVNAMFETDIKPGGDLKHYTGDGKAIQKAGTGDAKDDPTKKPQVCLWQVYDLDTKTTLVIVDGHKDFVMEPEAVTPATSSFWTIFPLTFNDVESTPGCKASLFPPSDVQLMVSPQKEWNRTRQALRQQRKANAPKYMCPKGVLSEADKSAIQNADDNAVIELENINPGTDPATIIKPLQVAAIDPAVYDTKPLTEDTLLATGQQEANVGPAQPNVTATVGSIAEQSRMTVSASNVDDLDDCLSAVAKCGGEMLLREMSPEVVEQIAGVGAVWPTQERESFLNQIELQIVASSSGRPNKAIEIANWEKLAGIILQAGGNPQAVIRESIKRLDDRLDPADFFPVPGMAPPTAPGAAAPGSGTPPRAPGGGAPPRPQRANRRGEGQMHPPPGAATPVPLGGA